MADGTNAGEVRTGDGESEREGDSLIVNEALDTLLSKLRNQEVYL